MGPLKKEVKKDYLKRIKTFPEKYNLETFYKKQHTFGTIVMMHNTDKDSEKIYVNYKSRGQIESMINVLKNIVDADKSYMQNEQALEARMLINYIALHWYYKIHQLLVRYELNKRFSPMDFVIFLKEVWKVQINGIWHNAEITAKTKDLLTLTKVHIT